MWKANGDDGIRSPFEEGCPQNNDKCTNTANFRNQLVQLITKINDDDVLTVNSAHTGMCMPIDIGQEDSRLELYMNDSAVEITQDDVMHIKGLKVYYPEPTTASPTSPTTRSPTTRSPTTLAPTTLAPTTLAPTTLAQATSPTTLSPTTTSPTTLSPTQPVMEKVVVASLNLGITKLLSESELDELKEVLSETISAALT